MTLLWSVTTTINESCNMVLDINISKIHSHSMYYLIIYNHTNLGFTDLSKVTTVYPTKTVSKPLS